MHVYMYLKKFAKFFAFLEFCFFSSSTQSSVPCQAKFQWVPCSVCMFVRCCFCMANFIFFSFFAVLILLQNFSLAVLAVRLSFCCCVFCCRLSILYVVTLSVCVSWRYQIVKERTTISWIIYKGGADKHFVFYSVVATFLLFALQFAAFFPTFLPTIQRDWTAGSLAVVGGGC